MRSLRTSIALAVAALLAALPAAIAIGEPAVPPAIGRAEFVDRRDPPPWRALEAARQEEYDVGLLVFNTPWVVAGTANAGRRDGLGPLFVSASCDGCHNNGARSRPAARADGLPNSFVMQLDGAGTRTYGAVLNTAALPGFVAEGRIGITWRERHGGYADGTPWTLREPRYEIHDPAYGPLPASTVLRPRIAPPVFGAGLLEGVPVAVLQGIRRRQPGSIRGSLPAGRFGWRADARDIEHQTALAFAREMGLTSATVPGDDCTPVQTACRAAAHGGTPEVSAEFMAALVTLQRELAVPHRAPLPAEKDAAGRQVFAQTGCAQCHVDSLTAIIDGVPHRFEAWSDLLLHDLGDGLADRRVDGRTARTRWRTAPLWGLAHALRFETAALLHDGRAANVEEAILWHSGQAEGVRRTFMALAATDRALLIEWVESL